MMKDLKIDEAKMVLVPVNDNEELERWGVGNDWTILIWDRINNIFYHIDPLRGQNTYHAKNLAADLLDGRWFNNDRHLQAKYKDLD